LSLRETDGELPLAQTFFLPFYKVDHDDRLAILVEQLEEAGRAPMVRWEMDKSTQSPALGRFEKEAKMQGSHLLKVKGRGRREWVAARKVDGRLGLHASVILVRQKSDGCEENGPPFALPFHSGCIEAHLHPVHGYGAAHLKHAGEAAAAM
jgi:hypothetical protein